MFRSTAVFTFLLPFVLIFHLPALSAGETRIGVVMSGNVPYYNEIHRELVTTLNNEMPSGEKFTIILQRPFPDPIALSNAARKLIATDVDLIIAYGSPATHAVLFEKSNIPVVYAGVYNPDGENFSGPKVTGCGYKVPISSLLRYLKNFKPITTLDVIYSSLEKDSVRQTEELAVLAAEQDIRLQKINIRSRMDIQTISLQDRGDAFFLTGSAVVFSYLDDLLAKTMELEHPLISVLPDHKEEGIILTLSHNPSIQGKKAAEMAARIIRGEQPSEIKPEVFRNSELVFNLREAKKMGLTIPINLIAEATRVIK